MVAPLGVAQELDTLVCDRKTLRGSIGERDPGAAHLIAQVSLYSRGLGVAIAQTTYATDVSGEIQALRQLVDAVELDGVLVQADARYPNRPFPLPRPARRGLPDRLQTRAAQGVSDDQKQTGLRPSVSVSHQQT